MHELMDVIFAPPSHTFEPRLTLQKVLRSLRGSQAFFRYWHNWLVFRDFFPIRENCDRQLGMWFIRPRSRFGGRAAFMGLWKSGAPDGAWLVEAAL